MTQELPNPSRAFQPCSAYNLPVYASTRQNQRANNEDSYQISVLSPQWSITPIIVLAVADGMGGHQYGEKASQEALQRVNTSLYEQLLSVTSTQEFQPYVSQPLTPKDLAHYLEEAVKAANQRVYQVFTKNHWEGGSTLVIAAIMGNTAVVTNLGDSPLYHYCRQDNTLQELSEEHSVAGILLTQGHISEEMAKHHMGRSQLQFFVGNDELPSQLPTQIVSLAEGDMLLLCSDGISNELSKADIQAILSQADAKHLQQAAEVLIHKAIEAQEDDNQTLILWSHQNQTNLSSPTPQQRQQPRQTESASTRLPSTSDQASKPPTARGAATQVIPKDTKAVATKKRQRSHPHSSRLSLPRWGKPTLLAVGFIAAVFVFVAAGLALTGRNLFNLWPTSSSIEDVQSELKTLEAQINPLAATIGGIENDLETIRQELGLDTPPKAPATSPSVPGTVPEPVARAPISPGIQAKNKRILIYATDTLRLLDNQFEALPGIDSNLQRLRQKVTEPKLLGRIETLQNKVKDMLNQKEKLAQESKELTKVIAPKPSPASPPQQNNSSS